MLYFGVTLNPMNAGRFISDFQRENFNFQKKWFLNFGLWVKDLEVFDLRFDDGMSILPTGTNSQVLKLELKRFSRCRFFTLLFAPNSKNRHLDF